MKDRAHACSFFLLAFYESADICDVAQSSIFVREIDDNFNVFEELIGFESLHGKTRGSDIFEKVKLCLESQLLDLNTLLGVCTDGAPSMIGKAAGAVALLERFLGRPLLKYHCIIHQESLCGKVLHLQHVMVPVVKCVNKIRARGLNRRQFREYCELLDEEYGDLILHCEVRWLSRGQVLKQFWKLKSFVHNFLEEKDELPEERALVCNESWLIDLAFLVDITSHLNNLNLKLQGKDQLFPSLVNDISAFKMKLKVFIAQLEKKDLSQLPHLKEQSESVENIVNFAKYIEKIKLLQEAFNNRFSDFSEEEDRMLAFINPFSLNERSILKMPSNLQMELIELKTNSILKMKFNELSLFPSASEMIGFWRSIPREHFPEMRKLAQSYACLFGTTNRCEQSFSSMKIIKNKLRSRLSDSNLKNCLLLSVTNLTPNITGLVKAESKVRLKLFMFILLCIKLILFKTVKENLKGLCKILSSYICHQY